MAKVLFYVLIISRFVGFSQTIKGKVVDATSANPVSYVNVNIPGLKAYKADSLGNFEIEVPEPDQIIEFSRVDYHPLVLRFSKKLNLATVKLQPLNILLKEVVIRPSGKIQSFSMDRTNLMGEILIQSTDHIQERQFEIGKVLNFKKGGRIENFSFYILKNSYEKVVVRMNVYRLIDGSPVPIVEAPHITKEIMNMENGWIKLECPEMPIIDGKVLLTYEFLDFYPKEGALSFSVKPRPFSPSFIRSKAESEWKHYPIAFPYSAEVWFPD